MECPICFNFVPMEIIDDHVNACLDFRNPSEDGNVNKRKELDDTSKRGNNNTTTSSRPNDTNNNFPSTSLVNKRKSTISEFFSSPTSSSSLEETQSTSKKQSKVQNDSKTTNTNNGIEQTVRKKSSSFKPLADQMRPMNLDDFVGQEHILGKNTILRRVLEADDIPSMILWGPPGCGKTSLANVINFRIQKSNRFKFTTVSATNSGINDIKDVVKIAKNEQVLLQRKTVLFVDEIHRFNKLQQDIFLPYVENGTITLIGATTENPSFSLNSALLSRCRVFVLEKLTTEQVEKILDRACEHLGIEKMEIFYEIDINDSKCNSNSYIESSALTGLAQVTDGDARVALNCLSLTLQSRQTKRSTANDKTAIVITREDISEGLQRSHVLYDRQGEEHYNCISALHKSMRGSDGNAALYWLGRILEGGEDPRYVARRLIRFASEDIGMADPNALIQAISAYQACQFIGMPECDVVLAQCVVYMSKAPKSISVYRAYSKVKDCIKEHSGPLPGVPLHLRNAPTNLMKSLGYAKGYKYNPMFDEPVEQDYLPECLKDKIFLE